MTTATTTHNDQPLEELIATAARQLDTLYRRLYPKLAGQLDSMFYVDVDGATYWLRSKRDHALAEPFESRDAAEEARKTMITYRLMERFNRDKAARAAS